MMVKFDLDVGEWRLLLGFLDGLITLPDKVQEVKDKRQLPPPKS